ncbi:hypothetical protein ET445_09435 [Agromyces protaetiae]|uniref:Secreted protein n=1 Tax=Agromyces protaetiae TaxID=2509455 RepID=A0A4P6FHW2_9MICO|nr:hypothetical protein [Agromyces protaetiae]QAY73527.1 hypothetical protein ET445_09435 [Agromyces protaetiae]
MNRPAHMKRALGGLAGLVAVATGLGAFASTNAAWSETAVVLGRSTVAATPEPDPDPEPGDLGPFIPGEATTIGEIEWFDRADEPDQSCAAFTVVGDGVPWSFEFSREGFPLWGNAGNVWAHPDSDNIDLAEQSWTGPIFGREPHWAPSPTSNLVICWQRVPEPTIG